MKILNIVGARPNFMKVAPIHLAFQEHSEIQSRIVHTGQHYDQKMSTIFFEQLGLPEPDYYLGVGSGSHTVQTAKVMMEFEPVLEKERPDLVLVVGDVNSTIACALVAKKSNVPVAHVEAGLRSGDRTMPEELNRIMTDAISDFLFVTEQNGLVNLAREGVADDKVFFVGNVMIDNLIRLQEKANQIDLGSIIGPQNSSSEFILVTMHRPSNVDNKAGLKTILNILEYAASQKTVVFPVHPRTQKNLKDFDLDEQFRSIKNLKVIEPQGYLEFLKLMSHASLVVTDSGGIQEETTYLKTPCITFRSSTERPSTILFGTNYLQADLNATSTNKLMSDILDGRVARPAIIPPFWDGRAAHRIAEIVVKQLAVQHQPLRHKTV